MKRVLITGANRGLGREVAMQMAIKGYTVFLTARTKEKADAAANDLRTITAHQEIHGLKMDVSSLEDIQNVKKELEAGGLDVLVNNAGIFPDRGNSLDVGLEMFKHIMETNFYGAYYTSRVFMPLLEKSKDGRIINVSSGLGALSEMGADMAGYRISKTAMNALTATMAADMAGKVKVFAVSPGWVKTDMGGPSAPRTLEQGGDSITYLVDAEDAKSGLFYRDGEVIEW